MICLSIVQLKYKFELPVEKLGFNSIATLVNSISDVVKKVIQGGMCLCLSDCVYVCQTMCVSHVSVQSVHVCSLVNQTLWS